MTRGLPQLERPEIYVGEGMDGYSIVDTSQTELTQDDLEAELRRARPGSNIDTFLRKAAFALRFGEIDPLISDLLTDESRVIYNRDVVERVQLLAPYLLLDPDPYPVLMDGGIKYVVDGYTTSRPTTPTAESFDAPGPRPEAAGETFNYVRNSVKAVVDAYDGTVDHVPLRHPLRRRGPDHPGLRRGVPRPVLRDVPEWPAPAPALSGAAVQDSRPRCGAATTRQSPSTFFNNSDLWDIAQDPPVGRSCARSTPLHRRKRCADAATSTESTPTSR